MSMENNAPERPAAALRGAFCPVSELKRGDVVLVNGEACAIDSVTGRVDTGFQIALKNGQRISVDTLSDVVEVPR